MGRPPSFWQRRGFCTHPASGRNRCAGSAPTNAIVEPMEQRILLAAQAAAANVFAQFEGTIVGGRSSVTIPINFSSSNFTFGGGKSVLGMQVVADSGSTLDPALIQIKDARNRAVATIFKNANLASRTQSLAVANFSACKYKLSSPRSEIPPARFR